MEDTTAAQVVTGVIEIMAVNQVVGVHRAIGVQVVKAAGDLAISHQDGELKEDSGVKLTTKAVDLGVAK